MLRKTTSRRTIKVNRAPVLTLWAAVVAERLGFDQDEAFTLGRSLAGLNAYSEGVSLGLFTPTPKEVKEKRKKLRAEQTITVDLLHRAAAAVQTEAGLRALAKDRPIDPASVQRYLMSKFGGCPRGRVRGHDSARPIPETHRARRPGPIRPMSSSVPPCPRA